MAPDSDISRTARRERQTERAEAADVETAAQADAGAAGAAGAGEDDAVGQLNPDEPLQSVAERMEAATEGEDKASVGEILDGAAGRAFGPLLLIPALLAFLPLVGAIPGMSILTASLLVLVAGQVLLGRTKPWVPDRLKRIRFKREPLTRGLEKAKPWLDKVDRVLRRRLTWMTKGPGRFLAMLAVIGMAALMYPLAFVPFGVTPPTAAILLIALGFTASDGAWVAAGTLGALAAAIASYWMLGGG
jgi:hypothetical protein